MDVDILVNNISNKFLNERSFKFTLWCSYGLIGARFFNIKLKEGIEEFNAKLVHKKISRVIMIVKTFKK